MTLRGRTGLVHAHRAPMEFNARNAACAALVAAVLAVGCRGESQAPTAGPVDSNRESVGGSARQQFESFRTAIPKVRSAACEGNPQRKMVRCQDQQFCTAARVLTFPLTQEDVSRLGLDAGEVGKRLQSGDHLWLFCSPEEDWRTLSGQAGIAVVRDGVVVDFVISIGS